MITLKGWDREFLMNCDGYQLNVESLALAGVAQYRITWPQGDIVELLYKKMNAWYSHTNTDPALLFKLGALLDSSR